MAQNENGSWETILGGAVEGGLSEWLDSPNDESVSASDAAATSGSGARAERTAVPQGSNAGNTGSLGWGLPQGNNGLLLIGGAVLTAILAAAVLAD